MRLWHLTIKRKLPWSAKQKRNGNLVKNNNTKNNGKNLNKRNRNKYENRRQRLNLQRQKMKQKLRTRKTQTSKQWTSSFDKYFELWPSLWFQKRHPANCYLTAILVIPRLASAPLCAQVPLVIVHKFDIESCQYYDSRHIISHEIYW